MTKNGMITQKFSRKWMWVSKLLLFAAPFNILMVLSVSSILAGSNVPWLNAEEQAWLAEHPVIRLAPDPDFPPIEYFDEEGFYRGIAADYLQILESLLPIKFEIVRYRDWTEVLAKSRNREVDMLGGAAPTPDRLQYLRFTPPYVKFPAVVLVRDSGRDLPSLSELTGKRVAVVANYVEHEFMASAYPQVSLEVMPDIVSGLRQVSFGRVDAMVANLASASYYIQKDGITNLKITEDTDFITDISFAVRSDWPELVSILTKTLDSIERSKKKAILGRWVALGRKPWRPSPFFMISVTALLLLGAMLCVLYWNRLLKIQVQERTAALEIELHDRLEAEREKSRLQQQVFRAKKMEALGLLAGGVAHDLNNILTGTVGYSELAMIKAGEDDEIHRYLLEIRGAGKRAGAVVADLLTISRDTALDRTVVSLNVVLQEYLQSPEHLSIQEKFPDVHITVDYGTDLRNVSCSVIHVKKSIMNLVLNAAEATRKGVVELRTANVCKFELDRPSEPGDSINYVVLSVADDGPGISEEDMERIFEPFYSKKKMGHSGTGLGLSIVWNTINEHGGWVDVNGTGKGTRFDLYFPGTELECEVNSEDAGTENLVGDGQHILVVDDEKQVREIARAYLENLGYRVAAVDSGAEAIAYVRQRSVDLLLLDMIMEPGINGYQTYKEILKFSPNQRAIITSGFSESSDVKKTQALGAGSYIMKPYTVQELAKVIKRELHREGK